MYLKLVREELEVFSPKSQYRCVMSTYSNDYSFEVQSGFYKKTTIMSLISFLICGPPFPLM